MKTIAVFFVAVMLWIGNTAVAADFGFLNAGVYGRAEQLNARVQAAQLQHQAKLARQVQFLQQQQLVAANAVSVHAQLAELRSLQQAQAFQALHLNQQVYAAPVVAAKQVVHQQPVVVQEQVCQPVQQVCQPVCRQRLRRSRSCR